MPGSQPRCDAHTCQHIKTQPFSRVDKIPDKRVILGTVNSEVVLHFLEGNAHVKTPKKPPSAEKNSANEGIKKAPLWSLRVSRSYRR